MNIQIVESYLDNQLRRDTVVGELLTVTEDRANMLIGLGKAKKIDLQVYEKKINSLETVILEKNKEINKLEKEIEKLSK